METTKRQKRTLSEEELLRLEMEEADDLLSLINSLKIDDNIIDEDIENECCRALAIEGIILDNVEMDLVDDHRCKECYKSPLSVEEIKIAKSKFIANGSHKFDTVIEYCIRCEYDHFGCCGCPGMCNPSKYEMAEHYGFSYKGSGYDSEC